MNKKEFEKLKKNGKTEKLYEFLHGLPKGGLLHIHLSGAIPVDSVLSEPNVYVKKRRDDHILSEKSMESLERSKIDITWLTNFLDKPTHSLISAREWHHMKIQCNLLKQKGGKANSVGNKFKTHLFRDYIPIKKMDGISKEKVRESLIFREGISAQNIGMTTGAEYAPTSTHLHEEFENKFTRLDQITQEIPRIRRSLRAILNSLWEDNVSYVELMFSPFGKVQRDAKSIRYAFGNTSFATEIEKSIKNGIDDESFELLCAEHVLRRLVDEVNNFNSCLNKKTILVNKPKQMDVRFLIGLTRIASNRRQRLTQCFELVSRFHNHVLSRYKGRVLGINLVGNEFAGSPSDYLRWFYPLSEKYAGEVKISLHAGESSVNDGHVLDSILLHAHRIGHGISLQHSPMAAQLVISKSIPIEVCLLSNKFLGYVPNVESHPAKKWFKEKMILTLNTDDPGIFETSLTDEFYYATLAFDLSLSDIERLCVSSISSSFLTEDEKSKAIKDLEIRLNTYIGNFSS